MNIRIIGTTNSLVELDQKKEYSGVQAGICYMQDDYDSLVKNREGAMTRIASTIENGHTSVMEHMYITVLFEKTSKAFAMLLNGLQAYNTSEKSGRYTVISEEGSGLYAKWTSIFKDLFSKDDTIPKNKLQTTINENARYVLSVFNKGTTFSYTTSWRMWNYIKIYCDRFITNANDTYSEKLSEELRCLSEFLADTLVVEHFSEPTMWRGFDFITNYSKTTGYLKYDTENSYETTYSIHYPLSFVGAAQAERHRTTNFCITVNDIPAYYVPKVLEGTVYKEEWLKDLATVEFPQAQLVQCHERGTIENFVLKCVERLCGAAQEEIREATIKNTAEYYKHIKGTDLSAVFNRVVRDDNMLLKCDICHRCNRPCGKKAELYNKFKDCLK